MNKSWSSNIYEIQGLLYILTGMTAIYWFDNWFAWWLGHASICWGLITLAVSFQLALQDFNEKRGQKDGS